jgi:enoyl-CoA hydratase/carnithine racemase
MTSFAALAGGRSTTHEALALGLAAELGCPEGDARARIQALADGLPAPGSPRAQLEAVRGLVDALGPAASGTLLLPRALDGGGHPAIVAVGAIATAARAGYAVEPVGDAGGRLYVAHAELAEPLVVDPRAPECLLDARALRVDLHWRCAHETALCVLDHAIAQAERTGDLATMLAASALRLSLPLERDARDAAAGDHARRLARLN